LDLTAAHPDVLIVVGTQTGNGEIVADAIAERLGALGFAAHVLDAAEAVPEDLTAYTQLVAVTCTWSGGTYPDNAVAFAEALDAVAPDLSRLAFGVVGLGDRDYDPFYQTAARRLDARLAAFGARRALPPHEIDGGPSPADVAGACEWAERLAAVFAAEEGGAEQMHSAER
jgi:MioC protein